MVAYDKRSLQLKNSCGYSGMLFWTHWRPSAKMCAVGRVPSTSGLSYLQASISAYLTICWYSILQCIGVRHSELAYWDVAFWKHTLHFGGYCNVDLNQGSIIKGLLAKDYTSLVETSTWLHSTHYRLLFVQYSRENLECDSYWTGATRIRTSKLLQLYVTTPDHGVSNIVPFDVKICRLRRWWSRGCMACATAQGLCAARRKLWGTWLHPNRFCQPSTGGLPKCSCQAKSRPADAGRSRSECSDNDSLTTTECIPYPLIQALFESS